MVEAPPALVSLVDAAWVLTSDKRGAWDAMQKTMNKKKSDALLALDFNAIGDLIFFEARISFEEARASLEQQPKQLNLPGEALYEWESAAFSVFDETKKALGINNELEQKKDELYNSMLQLSKLKKKYEGLKADRDKFARYRNSLEAKSSLLNELYQMIGMENPDWNGIQVWKDELIATLESQECLLSNALFAAGVLAYFGPFSWVSRDKLKIEWVKIFKEMMLKVRDNPQVSTFLGDANTLADWHQRNLLRDETCIENAFIIAYSSRWPLVIDPEGAAAKWLGGKNKLKDSSVHINEDLSKDMLQVSFVGIKL